MQQAPNDSDIITSFARLSNDNNVYTELPLSLAESDAKVCPPAKSLPPLPTTPINPSASAAVKSPSPGGEIYAELDDLQYDTNEAGIDISKLEENETELPIDIVAKFNTKISPVENSDGTITLDGNTISIEDWRSGQFNHLHYQVHRDDTHKVTTNSELIKAFNDHPYSGSKLGLIAGYVGTIFSFGGYSLIRRRVVPPGYFGHYISTERHKIVKAGVYSLTPVTSKWCEDILIDDEKNPNRKFGDKVILQVPENHLAGGYRIGVEGHDATDQEFVLFSQGRHVLPESKYYGVSIVKLDKERLTLGPLTVLYVKEGWIGGCYHRRTGEYKILYPGPPYILHEKNWQAIELVRRNEDMFKLGPYQFVTVKAGSLGGAYRKVDGRFQILPPGNSYQLHEKHYQHAEVKTRAVKFKLGPNYFINARPGYESGVHLKRSGIFVRLPPGKTYQLDQDEFREPEHVCRDSHITVCGPLTMLTVHAGTLNGAYRVSDGSFVEFDNMEKEYILHSKHWYGLVTIEKYSPQPQSFGPYKVVTIREGYLGLFEKEGKIEITKPGHYKLTSNYSIFEPIPVKIFQEMLNGIQFRTKDGIAMELKFSFTWHVTEPMHVAKFAGTFEELRSLLVERAQDSMMRLCKAQTRGALLPTKQDREVTGQELASEMEKRHTDLLDMLSNKCMNELASISTTSKLGVSVVKVQIDRFQLKDMQIMKDLEEITKAELAAKAEHVRGEFEIARALADLAAREKNAEADAKIALHEAKAAANVRRTEYEAKVAEAEAANAIKAAEEATLVKIATDKMIAEANAKAEAIKAITDAEYQKAVKEREAASAMGEKELELKRLELQVASLHEVGNAAWKFPDVYTAFLEQFGSNLRYGPLTAAETLSRVNIGTDINSTVHATALQSEA